MVLLFSTNDNSLRLSLSLLSAGCVGTPLLRRCAAIAEPSLTLRLADHNPPATPGRATRSEWCQRCVRVIARDPAAAVAQGCRIPLGVTRCLRCSQGNKPCVPVSTPLRFAGLTPAPRLCLSNDTYAGSLLLRPKRQSRHRGRPRPRGRGRQLDS